MAVNERVQDLEEEAHGLLSGQGQVSPGPHVLLQIEFTVLEHQPQFFPRIDNLFQPNTKGINELF